MNVPAPRNARHRAAAPRVGSPAPRRVRDEARERLAVMAFSVATSAAISISLLLLNGLAR
ncbi:MAG: hypothetical protein V9F00_14195 [Nocardioides sp.]